MGENMGYVISFFKAIFIFMGILLGVFLPGYLLQYVLNFIKLRFIGFILIAIITILGCSGHKDSKGALFSIVYIIGAISFLVQERKLDKSYKNIAFIKDNLSLSWAGLYSYIIPCIFLLGGSYDMTITVSLYISGIACILVGPMMISEGKTKIDKVKAIIDKNRIITFADIMIILQESKKSEESQEDEDKRMKEMLQIIDYFVEDKTIIGVDIDNIAQVLEISERLTRKIYPIYITPELNELLQNSLKNVVDYKEKLTLKEIIENITPLISTDVGSDVIVEHIAKEYIDKKSEWIDMDGIYVKESYIDKIIKELENQCSMYGEYDVSKTAGIFSLTSKSVQDIIDYRGFEYKNLSFTRTSTQNDNIIKQAELQFDINDFVEETKDNIENKETYSEAGKVDINTCSEEELSEIPMFGILNAKKAVKHREEINAYSNVDELIDYLRIKPHLIEKIKQHLQCNPIEKININKKGGRRIEF